MRVGQTERESRVFLGAFVDRDQRESLARLAREQDRSVSAVVRLAVAAHIHRSAERRPAGVAVMRAAAGAMLGWSRLGSVMNVLDRRPVESGALVVVRSPDGSCPDRMNRISTPITERRRCDVDT
jgi:hypothetical protein